MAHDVDVGGGGGDIIISLKHFLTSFRTLISMRVAPGTYYFIIFAAACRLM